MLRSSQVKKPGGLYENDKPRKTSHHCRSAVHAAHGLKRSGAKCQHSAYFIQHQRDPLHARTCLQVQPVRMLLRKTLTVRSRVPVLAALLRMDTRTICDDMGSHHTPNCYRTHELSLARLRS